MLRGLGSLLSRIFSSLLFYVPCCHLFLLLFRIIYFPRFVSGVSHPSFFSFSLPVPSRLFYLLSSFLYPCLCILSFLFRFFNFLRLLLHLSFLLRLFILSPTFWPQLHAPETWLTPLHSLKTSHRPHSPAYNNAPTCSRHSSWTAWLLMMGPIGFPKRQ